MRYSKNNTSETNLATTKESNFLSSVLYNNSKELLYRMKNKENIGFAIDKKELKAVISFLLDKEKKYFLQVKRSLHTLATPGNAHNNDYKKLVDIIAPKIALAINKSTENSYSVNLDINELRKEYDLATRNEKVKEKILSLLKLLADIEICYTKDYYKVLENGKKKRQKVDIENIRLINEIVKEDTEAGITNAKISFVVNTSQERKEQLKAFWGNYYQHYFTLPNEFMKKFDKRSYVVMRTIVEKIRTNATKWTKDQTESTEPIIEKIPLYEIVSPSCLDLQHYNDIQQGKSKDYTTITDPLAEAICKVIDIIETENGKIIGKFNEHIRVSVDYEHNSKYYPKLKNKTHNFSDIKDLIKNHNLIIELPNNSLFREKTARIREIKENILLENVLKTTIQEENKTNS